MTTVLFRCDGLSMLGHLSRCMALAEALREIGWRAVFRSAQGDAGRALLTAGGFEARAVTDFEPEADARHTAAAAKEIQAAWIVLDGYEFTPAFADRLADTGAKVLVIDDFAAWPRYPAHAVLNCDIGAETLCYPPGPARLLLGPQYFLARLSLRRMRKKPRTYSSVARLCIAFSGDASGERTFTALRAFEHTGSHVRPIVADGPRRGDIERTLALMGRESRLRLIPQDISEDLAWADAVICTGGMIKYEAIFLGVFPLVASNTPAEASDTERWLSLGVGVDLGPLSTFDESTAPRALAALSAAGATRRQDVMQRAQALFTDDPTRAAAQALVDLS